MVTAHLLIFVNESYDLFPAATKEQAVWKFFFRRKKTKERAGIFNGKFGDL